MLNTITEIDLGKQLQVGHHKVHAELATHRVRTLNMDKRIQDAEKIDQENKRL